MTSSMRGEAGLGNIPAIVGTSGSVAKNMTRLKRRGVIVLLFKVDRNLMTKVFLMGTFLKCISNVIPRVLWLQFSLVRIKASKRRGLVNISL